jgi:uncharacterized SAM-binding protein YcdF (DUF218 family)
VACLIVNVVVFLPLRLATVLVPAKMQKMLILASKSACYLIYLIIFMEILVTLTYCEFTPPQVWR